MAAACQDNTFRIRVTCTDCGTGACGDCTTTPAALCVTLSECHLHRLSGNWSAVEAKFNGRKVKLVKDIAPGPGSVLYKGTFTITLCTGDMYPLVLTYCMWIQGLCSSNTWQATIILVNSNGGVSNTVGGTGDGCSETSYVPPLFTSNFSGNAFTTGINPCGGPDLGYTGIDILCVTTLTRVCSPFEVSGTLQDCILGSSCGTCDKIDFDAIEWTTDCVDSGGGGGGGANPCCDDELVTNPDLSVTIAGCTSLNGAYTLAHTAFGGYNGTWTNSAFPLQVPLKLYCNANGTWTFEFYCSGTINQWQFFTLAQVCGPLSLTGGKSVVDCSGTSCSMDVVVTL